MKKLILPILISLTFISCNNFNSDHNNNEPPIKKPTKIEDIVTDFSKRNADGKILIPEYKSKGFNNYSIITYYAPKDYKDDMENAPATNFTLSVEGENQTQNSGRSANNFSNSEENRIEENLKFHNELRQKENKLLNSLKNRKNNQNSRAAETTTEGKPSKVFNIGDKWENIWVWNYHSSISEQEEVQINATCVAISDEAYFFVEDGFSVENDVLEKSKTEIKKMLPILREKFAKENDIDNNGKIIFLFYNSNDRIDGFFYGVDQYLKKDFAPGDEYYEEIQYSNEADILYISLTAASSCYSIMMHELQHLVCYSQFMRLIKDGVENVELMDTWIDEGLAMEAEVMLGGYDEFVTSYIRAFFERYDKSNISFVQWQRSGGNVESYGYSFLFIHYLIEQYGEEVIKKLYEFKGKSIKSIEYATGKNFNELFKDFILTLIATGKVDDPKYNYKNSMVVESLQKYGFKDSITDVQGQDSLTKDLYPYTINFRNWSDKELKEATLLGSDLEAFGFATK